MEWGSAEAKRLAVCPASLRLRDGCGRRPRNDQAGGCVHRQLNMNGCFVGSKERRAVTVGPASNVPRSALGNGGSRAPIRLGGSKSSS